MLIRWWLLAAAATPYVLTMNLCITSKQLVISSNVDWCGSLLLL
jgi:hypothetical protein